MSTSPSQVLLMDGTTGVITSMLDGVYVTQLRTGASSGAAFDLFAKIDSKIGDLIGIGILDLMTARTIYMKAKEQKSELNGIKITMEYIILVTE